MPREDPYEVLSKPIEVTSVLHRVRNSDLLARTEATGTGRNKPGNGKALIQQTQERFDITSVVISHDMASTFWIGHMITMLYQGRIVAFGSPAELRASRDPHVQRFIHAGSVDVH